MPKITSGLIDGLNGRFVILEEDGLYWAAEIVDISEVQTSQNYADVAHDVAAYQRSMGSPKSAPDDVTSHAVTVSSN